MCSDSHILMVVLVADSRNLEQKFLQNRMSKEQSQYILKNYLHKNSDSRNEVVIEGLKVDMKCQYFQTKIVIPVRSKHCTSHYQPFDLKGFLAISSQSKNGVQKWKCPICRKRAYDLVVDDYLLGEMRVEKNISEMIFNKDGELKYVEESSDSDL